MSQVVQVFLETGVLQDLPVLDLRGLQERKVFKVFQEDLEVLVHPVRKENPVCQWRRRAYQDPGDRMESQDCPAHQEAQVSPDSLVSLGHQEAKVNLDFQELDSQDLQVLKDSQVSPASQELLEDQADQELMVSLDSLDSLDPRVSLVLAFLAPQVYQVYLVPKGSLDQREILVSLAALAHLEDLVSMVLLEPKVSPVYLVHLEVVAHLDPPPLAHWDHLAHQDLLAQWDHQVSLD